MLSSTWLRNWSKVPGIPSSVPRGPLRPFIHDLEKVQMKHPGACPIAPWARFHGHTFSQTYTVYIIYYIHIHTHVQFYNVLYKFHISRWMLGHII